MNKINKRVDALVMQFEQATRELTATVEKCSAADWKRIPAGEKDSVGVLAHHIAADFDLTYQFAHALAFGGPQPAQTWDVIDQANERHSAAFANVSKEAVLELLQANIAPTANALRRLTDAQLDNSAIVLGKEMTVEGVIEEFVIGHVHMHLPGIEAALAK